MHGHVQPDGLGAQVALRVQGTFGFWFTPTFTGTVRPLEAGSVLTGEVVEHGLVRGYAKALWGLLLFTVASVLLSLIFGGVQGALQYGLIGLLSAPLIVVMQHVWFGFARLLYSGKNAQLTEYLTTCCQAQPQRA